ncbi:MAG: ankyrin repeat domain-containing protein [Phycisphaeraceae bacterium]|nr:ankyrin repeat domain-containing protein [Phycisphaeraceae bacterium]
MKLITLLFVMSMLFPVSWIASASAADELPALHQAVLLSKLQRAEQLLADTQAHNPNERDVLGSTPLHLAVRADQVQIVKLLLEHGANGNLIDGRGQNAMDQAKSWSVWWMLLRWGSLPGMDTAIFLIAITLLVVLAFSVWLRKVKTEASLEKLSQDDQSGDSFRDAA